MTPKKDYEFIFSKYSAILNGELKGNSVLNYLSSHDDGGPFDAKRTKTIEAGTKLLLSPGIRYFMVMKAFSSS
jgi:alpha-amylase